MRTAAVLGFLCLLALPPAFPQGTTPPQADTTPPAPAPGGPAAGVAGTSAPSGPTKPDLSLPKDTAAQWQIGISVFSSDGLSPDNAYLAYSLPLLLKDEVSGFSVHTYQEEESALARKAQISRAIAESEKALTNARKERDALLFNQVPEGSAARTSVEARLAAATARLDYLRTLSPARVEVAGQKPVVFKEGTGAGKLLEAPAVPPEIYCAQQGIDLLIGGTIQEVQGYLLLDVWAFDSLNRARVFSSRNAASREELTASLQGFGREIARTILGRPWSLVAFTPDPPDTALYVDGVLAASGASPALYLSPGPHEIRLSAVGYHDVSRSLSLEPEKETRVDDALSRIAAGQVAISSDPAGADLYVDSLWRGRTPIVVDRPPLRSRGVLSSPGFYDLAFPLEPASPAVLSFSLQKDLGNRDVQQKKARDEFYVSLGFFALSLPLPLLSYALAIDFAVKTLDLNGQGMSAAAAQAQTESTVFLGAYYVGVAVSVSLFVWMVTRIVHYVRVADEIAG
ncbi:MAG: PEGA domain-containing protein [Spirochaetia bacterium]